ncbi:MAG: chromosome segregation protein SMC [Planctomycetota bacterium]
MRLKRLVCRGFKSFADRTEFDFDASLTGIIGPNGCGKSNVVDALKWVLGDQRARSLRGKEMTDVIFKGAEGRDAMPFADVEILLEDDDGLLAGRSEFTIGRRLTRERESVYMVNGEVTRLKDVRSTLMDTGLGVGAYSVMEQGRIDAVLSADPEERRAIFEEAAGISRFKLQKRETLRRLDRTEQNLARVTDLLEERGRRIRSLKVQASKARRFRELRRELRGWKASLAVDEALTVRRAAEERQDLLEARHEALREAEGAREEIVESLASTEGRIVDVRAALDVLIERGQQVRSSAAGARQRAEALAQRQTELRADAEGYAAQQQSVREQHEESAAALEAARERMARLELESEELTAQLLERSEVTGGLRTEVAELRALREAARQRALDWMHRMTQARNEAHAFEGELRAQRARERKLIERIGTLDREEIEVESAREELTQRQERNQTRTEGLQEQSGAAQEQLAAADAEAATLVAREGALRERLSSVTGRMQVLADMERHLEGLDHGPRHLLAAQPTGLRGRLLDLLEVAVEDSRALEAALGPLVQALVVDTREHADVMLAELESAKKGRALLLVEEEFADVYGREPIFDLPPQAEPLISKVRCDARARPLLGWLLRGVCLVPSLAEARADRHDLCFVTPTGGLLCGPRIEGGTGEQQGGLVVRKAQLRDLGDEEGQLQTELESLLEGKRAAIGRVDTHKRRVEELTEQLAGLRTEEQELLGEQRRLDGRAEDIRRQAELTELEHGEVHRRCTTGYAALADCVLQAHLLSRLEERENAAERAAAAEATTLEERVRAASEAEQEVRLRQVACTTDREALTGTIGVHERGLEDLDRSLRELADREQSAQEAVQRAHEEEQDRREEAERFAAESAEVDAARATQQAAVVTIEQEREEQRAGLSELDERRSALGDEVSQLRLELADLHHKFSRVEDRLREDTGIELRRCLGEVHGLGLVSHALMGPPPANDAPVVQLIGPPLPPEVSDAESSLDRLWEREDFAAAEAKRTIAVLQAKVDRLGSVNLDAVRELEEMEQGYVQLEQDVEDLREARKSLIETLRTLETESRALFEGTFEQARANFQGIFRKLFQGGRADMTLTPNEDSLEAGIEIVAKPPGKELQSINLLSGGERSMTALAILFAVFKVKPSPFCILDEVDAALDDSNVERFLRVLRDFVGPTQFCIVTHHKRTMAECQRLYGITMQKRGVSSPISVSLEEVDGLHAGGVAQRDPMSQRIAGEEQVGFESS